MNNTYELVSWSDFARDAKKHSQKLVDGVPLAVVNRGKVIATVEPYDGRPINVFQIEEE